MQRVSGVNVQDGRYIVVRGLGERYTTASLNGARLPSPEPERRVVPLDLFPAGLLQSVTTSKTFTPDQPGDFSGAEVNIQTREFPAERLLSLSVSAGYNDAATGKSILAAPTVGGERLAMTGSGRDRPSMLASAGNLRGSTQQDFNQYISSFRNAWSADRANGAPNYGLGVTLGGNDPLFGQRIGYVGSFTMSNAQEVRTNEERGLAIATTDGQSAQYSSRFTGETGRMSSLWGGVLNLSTLVGSSRFAFNNTYNRTADNEARRDFGLDENLGANLERTTLRYVERSVRSNQLRGEHVFGGRAAVDWNVTSSGVTRMEPDRSDLVYIEGEDERLTFFSVSSEAARRTFGDLDESTLSGGLNGRLSFGVTGQDFVKFGTLLRTTNRDSFNQSYSIYGSLPVDELARPAEEIFDGRYTQPSSNVFTVLALTSGGSYVADDRVNAYYGMLHYGLTDRVQIVGGLRAEQWRLRLRAERADSMKTDVPRNETDLLPSLAINVGLTESQNLRFSGSQTLSRPEYRELAPITYLDIIGGEAVIGNDKLRRTVIRNADVRWEWYPNVGELISIAGFYKRFDKPIERVQVATSGSSLVSYANAVSARNYGVELEARKGLAPLGSWLAPVTLFTNVTVMASDIEVDTTGTASIENVNRAMVGQAPYVANAGITYAAGDGRASATVLYNVVGKRIQSAAASGLPDVYEMPRHMLDFSVRFPVVGGVTAKLDARNILNARHRLEQGPVTREAYDVGRIFSLGMTWTPGGFRAGSTDAASAR
jgi:TonB-dependent receptor